MTKPKRLLLGILLALCSIVFLLFILSPKKIQGTLSNLSTTLEKKEGALLVCKELKINSMPTAQGDLFIVASEAFFMRDNTIHTYNVLIKQKNPNYAQWTLQSKVVIYDQRKQTFRCVGDVLFLNSDKNRLKTDECLLDLKQKTIQCAGNIEATTHKSFIKAQRASIDLREKKIAFDGNIEHTISTKP